MPSSHKVSRQMRDPVVLREAIDERGRYDATKMAKLLDWTRGEMAEYLGKDPSTISRFGSSVVHQNKLAELAALVQELLTVMNNDLPCVRAWFRTPLRALDKASPQDKILHGELEKVDDLVDEFRSGLAL